MLNLQNNNINAAFIQFLVCALGCYFLRAPNKIFYREEKRKIPLQYLCLVWNENGIIEYKINLHEHKRASSNKLT